MKINCKIIQDILPLYAEDILSDETKAFVDEHLSDCENCRSILDDMKNVAEIPDALDAAPLVYLKKKLFHKRIITVSVTSVIALAVALAVMIMSFVYLTSPKYIPYSFDVVTIMDETYWGGIITCHFDEKVSGYKVDSYWSEDGTTEIYKISAWKTAWDGLMGNKRTQQFLINPPSIDDGKLVRIYYVSYDGTEDVFIYGNAPLGSGVG